MRKELVVLPLTIIVLLAAWLLYRYDSRPPFVAKAEARVSSYLSDTYGNGGCEAVNVTADRWDLECRSNDGINIFKYALYPPEKAPYDVADGFYLVALNAAARKSATEGLTLYLKIGSE